MKRSILLAVMLVLCLTAAHAQSLTACPGLHNPTNFNPTPGGMGSWSARVGDRVGLSGTGSTGNNILSTCVKPSHSPITGANILSSTYYSGYCQYTCGAYPGTGCAHTFSDANDHRFTIYTSSDAGLDEFTINSSGQGMQRIPPNHLTSIRLGDMRSTGTAVYDINNEGNNKGSEALFYTMRVNSQNALLFIDYAIVARKYSHTAYDAGEFSIRVVGKTGNQWNNEPLTPALFYNVPAPSFSGALPAPWIEGRPGGSSGATYCGYCYKDWTRVAISLIDYIYDSVRIEMYTSDCLYNVDPIYAYIAGSCQPMIITASGCPGGESNAVDTLRAPADLLTYTWYVADDGYSGNTSSQTQMANVPFRLVQATSSSNTYISRVEDFITNTGEEVGVTTYKCVMTSALNPDMPFESVVYATVSNTKPIINASFETNCDSTITFHALGRIPFQGSGAPRLVDSATTWTIFEGSSNDTPIIDTVHGNIAQYQFSDTLEHAVTLTMYTEDTSCYTDRTFLVKPIMPPHNNISIDKRTLCVGDTSTITDLTENINRRIWEFENDTIDSESSGQNLNSTRQLKKVFTEFANPFRLITFNRHGCSDTLYDTIFFFHDPEITYSNDTIICNGHETHVTVSTPVTGCNFEWYRHYDQEGESPICTGNVLMVRPTQPKTTYYLKILAKAGCVAWDSVNIRLLTTKITANPSNGKICPDSVVTLTGSGALYYQWYSIPPDPSLESQEHNQTIMVSPKQDTRYYLIGYAADSCDIAAIDFLVKYVAVPELDFEYSPHYIDTEIPVVNFTDLSEGRDHTQWVFGDGGTSSGQSVTHHFDIYQSGSNWVTLRSYNEVGCHVDTTFWIDVDTFGFYRPNVFTPNKNENNTFFIVCPSTMEKFHIAIYNRRGLIVYESDDQHFQWDGTRNGTALPTGAYPYVITYTRAGSVSTTRLKGSVLLLR